MKNILYYGTVLLCMYFALPAFTAEYALMKDGRAVSSIVLKSNESASRHAAEELSLYLGKIANGKGPVISSRAEKEFYPVTLEIVKEKDIQDEGYALTINDKGIFLQAKEPIGLIYGAYGILKKYGNIRWLIPGKEGEFYKIMPDIKVKDMKRTVYNPSFPIRRMHFNSARVDRALFDTWDWMLRNNLRIETRRAYAAFPQQGIDKFLAKRAVAIQEGWHCFTRLHNGIRTAKNTKKLQFLKSKTAWKQSI